MGYFEQLARSHPDLKRRLIMAKMDPDPEKYVQSSIMSSIMIALTFSAAYFLFAKPFNLPLVGMIPIFLLCWWFFYKIMVQRVDVKIRRIAKDIDREVLFAGRFLLVKLNAGRPLITALTEASKSYGVATKYFKEIVTDIDMGTTLEDALSKAARYSPSEKFRKILFQITNALKIGVDVTNFLEAILDEIAAEQLIEIQRYGKKLNSLTMFYMLFSIVIPSLGITLFVTIISMMNAQFDLSFFLFLAFMLCVLELIFISIFKHIRPTMNI